MPAVTYAAIETSLCKWLHDVTGYPAIMNAQNAPQPQKPYFDVTLRTRDNPGPVAGAGLDEKATVELTHLAPPLLAALALAAA